MSGRRPLVPPTDDEGTRLVRFRTLLRSLALGPGPLCGLCDGAFFAGQSVTLLQCGHIMHRDCVIDADYRQVVIERRRERPRCPHCSNPILTDFILRIPQAPAPPVPPPSASSSAHGASGPSSANGASAPPPANGASAPPGSPANGA